MNWIKQNDNYRELIAEVDNYMLVIKGGRSHEFNWVVFYNSIEIASNGSTPCRSTLEAQRTCEAIYQLHKNHLQ